MSYSGKFKPVNLQKYLGDAGQIYYRSSWELSLMSWCDKNPQVVSWSSEELIIPYLCPTDGKMHRYYIDFVITFDTGQTYWIEVKPKKYTQPPKQPKRKTKKYVTEVVQFVKNQAKWKTANEYATKHGHKFQVWTEDSLKSLGIKLLGK